MTNLRSGFRPRRPRGKAAADQTEGGKVLSIQKVRRQVDRAYIRFIHTKRCLICRREDVDAHHLHTKGAGGSDFTCTPLCRVHHQEWHQLGPRRFEEIHDINLWRECARLLIEYFTGVAT